MMNPALQSSPVTRRDFLRAMGVVSLASTLTLPSISARESETDGFRDLFNGIDLDGWHRNSGDASHGTGGRWLVEDGILTGEQDPPGSGNGGLLLSDGKYGDFELLIDMHPDWGPDTGVFFRCTEEAAGYQMYVDYHDNGSVGHLRGEMPGAFAMKPFKILATLNAVGQPKSFTTEPDARAEKWPSGVYAYSCTPDVWLKAWKPGEWNTAKIRCVGKYPKITTWINGVRICHFDSETTTMPGHDKDRVLGILGRTGSIGLQVHGGKSWVNGTKCRWRGIRIKEV